MSDYTSPHENLPSEDLEVLEARLQRLATAEERSASHSLVMSNPEEIYLCFKLLDDRFAIPLMSVEEVIALRSIVMVPGVAEHIAGITRLRGKILALVDLRRFWYKATSGRADSDLAVVLHRGDVRFGLICNEVEGLREIPPKDIKETPKNLPSSLSACIRGITLDEIRLISPENLLSRAGFLAVAGDERGERT
jgi:purine-binding chemotaxis protein CheW